MTITKVSLFLLLLIGLTFGMENKQVPLFEISSIENEETISIIENIIEKKMNENIDEEHMNMVEIYEEQNETLITKIMKNEGYHAFNFLDVSELLNLRLTCKKFCDADILQYVWKEKTKNMQFLHVPVLGDYDGKIEPLDDYPNSWICLIHLPGATQYENDEPRMVYLMMKLWITKPIINKMDMIEREQIAITINVPGQEDQNRPNLSRLHLTPLWNMYQKMNRIKKVTAKKMLVTEKQNAKKYQDIWPDMETNLHQRSRLMFPILVVTTPFAGGYKIETINGRTVFRGPTGHEINYGGQMLTPDSHHMMSLLFEQMDRQEQAAKLAKIKGEEKKESRLIAKEEQKKGNFCGVTKCNII